MYYISNKIKLIIFFISIKFKSLFCLKIKKNVFKQNHHKKVLISFITFPFQSNINFSHTNQNECFFAAKIFDELGYNVDVINYNQTTKKINYSEYQVLYGFGDSIENYYLKYKKDKSGPHVILYLNGSYIMYSNLQGALRIKNMYNTKSVFFPKTARISDHCWNWSHHMADALIVLGNKTIASTYNELQHQNILSLNAFFYKNKNINIEKKDFTTSRNNFLWFGSSGSIHKGLDLVLEYFILHPEFELHICGLQEKEFEQFYYKELKNKNIHNHGNIDIYGEEFEKLMHVCNFCVFPSISEGGGVSVLTCMGNGGLIPIISKATGLDVDYYGVVMDEISLTSLNDAINIYQNKSVNELKIISRKIQTDVSELYTVENYIKNLKKIIQNNI